jgi:hypothetical protein
MTRLRAVTFALIAASVAVAVASPGPGPGQPFGGDDTGCVPPSRARVACAVRVARALRTLTSKVTQCHVGQADARYKEVVLGGHAAADDQSCEDAAATRFDTTLTALSRSSDCAGSTIVSSAAAEETTLLADQTNPLSLDARNGSVYCDPTSAVLISPGGDDAGFVPSTTPHRRCADRVALRLARLDSTIRTCHATAADRGLRLADPSFDEEACEAKALARYDLVTKRLVARNGCPACLSATNQDALAVDLVAERDAVNANLYPCPDDVLHPGTLRLDRPTLMALGVQLFISGDDNHDASVTVRYRPTGSPTWRDALPLYRVRPESVPGRVVAQQFAGSLFDLRPATTYEIELHATDPDGPVDQTLTLSGTTRDLPHDPAAPHLRPVSDTAGLTAALATAAPGDVITLADGVYAGPFALDTGGTAANPIVIRGTSEEGTILDGGGCDACNVLEVYGSFVHVENLTLRAANRALRFQTAAAEGNVARRVHSRDTTLGFGSREDQRDFYLCDNILEGRLVWPHVYTDDDGAHSNDDGIHVEGDGHVVCHNQIVGFGDAMKTEQVGARAVDFYGNEVLSAYDNGVELDVSEGNTRALRNRFTNTFGTISFQPIYGGPAYAIRNVVVNVANEQMKFHGLGSATGPSGVLALQNTFVSPGMALFLNTSAGSHHFSVENNLFVGPATLAGDKTVDWLGPIDDGRFDYDGYFPDGVFRFNLPPAGLVSYATFAAMQAGGLETHGVLMVPPIFASGLAAPVSYTVTLPPQDVTLDVAANAIDRGVVLPNVTDGFTGAAPDLGALERGCPAPVFGVRPLGIDDTNEPLGCAP